MRIPTLVTVLSGLLGSGKTTLLNEILATREGHLPRGEDRFIELSNGCICCTLREDLVDSVGELADGGRFDHILIESTGISEPMPVAATFEWEWEDGTRLADIAPISTMVTLVDAVQFLDQIRGHDVAQLLIDQVEFADRIFITKGDLVPAARLKQTIALVRTMNPRADVSTLVNDQLNAGSTTALLLDASRYDENTARTQEDYLEELANPRTPETEEYGISSVAFRSSRPFNKEKLLAVLRSTVRLVRSKGYCWIDELPSVAQVWHQAGPDLSIRPAMYWARHRPDPRHRGGAHRHPLRRRGAAAPPRGGHDLIQQLAELGDPGAQHPARQHPDCQT